ncbi:MAG: sigma factor-like helix-turn-helix DNA-binding protein [Thermincolia bacterium]
MKRLIESYQNTIRTLKKKIDDMPYQADDGLKNPQRELLSSALSGTRFAVTIMRSHGQVWENQDITRLSYIQREIPYDLEAQENAWIVARAVAKKNHVPKLTNEQLKLLDDILAMLTPKEREVYVMVKGHGYSWEYTARILGVTKSSVQTYLDRAQEKIHRALLGGV